ncbi:hypothetical protein A0U91_15985 (plasmid) [Acetobacter persici]|uniref:Bacterial shufflon protein N-terminal domain-containing protein n=1 Tax=Acetobacter persici TaxID=1076596 RepID=A0A1U9LJ86_9PROT|nr:hypothetical protein A0U91_15985 [Acetobacter persici]
MQVSASLIVMALMAGVLGSEVNQQIKKSKDNAAADQLNEVYVAAQNWVKGNTQDLGNLVADSGGVYQIPAGRLTSSEEIPEDSLQGQGFMPSGFVDTNPYGQHTVMTVWADENNPSGYNMMVFTTGGETVKDADIGRIGQKLSAAGGGYYSKASGGRPAGTISGVGGGWSYPASELAGDYATPTPGHVAASGQFTISGGLADFLYRNDIGVHEANTMHTNIDMTGNNLNSVNKIDNENPTTGVSNGSLGIGSSIVGRYNSDANNHTIYVDSDMNICHNDGISSPSCGISIANTGGFYHNGSWISYWGGVSGGGLHIEGPGNNFQVDGGSNLVGQITAETGLDLISGGPITWSQAAPGLSVAGDTSPYNRGYQLHVMGRPLTVDAMAYFDGNVTSRYVYDTDNANYYLHPSGRSQLASAQFSGHVGTNGMDPDTGYPDGYTGGVHTKDVYAENGTLATGTNGNVAASLSGVTGNLYATGTSQLDHSVNIGTFAGASPRATLSLQNGDIWVNDGNTSVSEGPGSDHYGGAGWYQSGLTVGRAPSGELGHYPDGVGRGGDFHLYGNMYGTGTIVFVAGQGTVDGLTLHAIPDGLSGVSCSAYGESTGIGTLAVTASNKLTFCAGDGKWHDLIMKGLNDD